MVLVNLPFLHTWYSTWAWKPLFLSVPGTNSHRLSCLGCMNTALYFYFFFYPYSLLFKYLLLCRVENADLHLLYPHWELDQIFRSSVMQVNNFKLAWRTLDPKLLSQWVSDLGWTWAELLHLFLLLLKLEVEPQASLSLHIHRKCLCFHLCSSF